MSDDIRIQSERADHPQVVALLNALDRYLGELYEPDANHILSVNELLLSDVSFFVAWHGEKIVGTGAVRRLSGMPETQGQDFGEIKRMYVDPAWRGRGIAQRMLQTLEDALRAQGYAVALLETGEEQREAVRLYERVGYRRRAAFAGYPDNGFSVFMQKNLA